MRRELRTRSLRGGAPAALRSSPTASGSTLTGRCPPLWRQLELASDLYLDEVHAVIQAAFGWTDSHLHRFGSGPDYYSRDTEYYLCPFEVREGETGTPEDEVRLDEVLYDVGGGLFYCYDFGDDWQHVIKLEAVLPRGESAPRAACTAGRRPGPPEDCGGVYAYELICAAIDPEHPGHKAAVGEFGRFYGHDIHPRVFGIVPFDAGEANGAIAALGMDDAGPQPASPGRSKTLSAHSGPPRTGDSCGG